MTAFGALRDRLSSQKAATHPRSAEDPAEVIAEAPLPFPGFDRLDENQVVGGLSDHSQLELKAVEAYERSHGNRDRVMDKLRYMRGREPLAGYDALGIEEILAVLATADPATIKRIRSYERKFANRGAVLDEVVRVHHRHQAAHPAAVAPPYQPLSSNGRHQAS